MGRGKTSKQRLDDAADKAGGGGFSAAKALLIVVVLVAITLGTVAIVQRAGAPPSSIPIPDPVAPGMQPQVVQLIRDTQQRVEADQMSASAWAQLGRVYDAHSLYDEAIICYERARALNDDEFEFPYLLAIVREFTGAVPAETIPLLEAAAERRNDYAPLHLRLGDQLARAGEPAKAAAAYRRAIALNRDYAVAHRGLGQSLLASGDVDQARVHLERVVQLAGEDRGTFVSLAQVYRRLGEDERATRTADRAADLRDQLSQFDEVRDRVSALGVSSELALERATSLMRSGRYRAAIPDLQIVLSIRPDDPNALWRLGRSYLNLGDLEQAQRYLTDAIAADPETAPALVGLGAMAVMQNQLVPAERLIRRALTINDASVDAHALMGIILTKTQRFEPALGEFEYSAKNGSITEAAYAHWGDALLQLGLQRWQIEARQRPNDPDARFALGLCYERSSRGSEAMQEYRAAVAADPTHHANTRVQRLQAPSPGSR